MDRREALATLLSLPASTVITKTELRPYDLVVFSVPGSLSVDEALQIKERFEAAFTDTNLHLRAIVLTQGMTVSVVRDGAKP